MNPTAQAIVAAAIGGASPSLLYLAMACTKNPPDMPTGTFFLGALIWFLLGGAAGWISGELNLKKAFYIGVGLPAFIQANVANYTDLNRGDPAKAAGFSLITRAQAQEVPAPIAKPPPAKPAQTNRPALGAPGAAATNRVLQFLPNEALADFNLFVFSADGKPLEQRIVNASRTNRIVLPPKAQRFVIQSDQFGKVQEILLTNTSGATRIQLISQKRTWSGFERSLGFKGVKDYHVEVLQQNIGPAATGK